MSPHAIAFVLITFGAAIVNGALGYGFSSITVPLALLFLSNRQLNPALVLIEVALNAYVLWVNRDALGIVWRRVLPIVVGLLPGVIGVIQATETVKLILGKGEPLVGRLLLYDALAMRTQIAF